MQKKYRYSGNVIIQESPYLLNKYVYDSVELSGYNRDYYNFHGISSLMLHTGQTAYQYINVSDYVYTAYTDDHSYYLRARVKNAVNGSYTMYIYQDGVAINSYTSYNPDTRLTIRYNYIYGERHNPPCAVAIYILAVDANNDGTHRLIGSGRSTYASVEEYRAALGISSIPEHHYSISKTTVAYDAPIVTTWGYMAAYTWGDVADTNTWRTVQNISNFGANKFADWGYLEAHGYTWEQVDNGTLTWGDITLINAGG